MLIGGMVSYEWYWKLEVESLMCVMRLELNLLL
jgi:hypothetical protein